MNIQDKNFRRFLIIWSGQLLSAIGSGLTAFALGVFVFQNTQSAMSYSLIIFFSFLPTFILLPFGGVLADRLDRKKMMIIGDTGAITGLLFILLAMLWGSIELWHIYFGVAMSSVFSAIHTPAYKAAVSDLVTEELYSQASGLIQLAGSAQYLISPIVAGFLMSIFDIKVVLIIDIMTFLFAIAAVFIIKKQGRVWSLVYTISQVGYILAFASAGFLADHLFNPLFYPDGALSQTVGQIIGIGKGRGIGFLFILSGLLVSILALIIGRSKQIRALELKTVD